jgi:hypothetical protein
MEAMANFFEWINSLLGVKSGSELVFHPVVIGLFIVLFIYSVIMHMKYFALCIAGVVGGAALFSYMYPADTSNLLELLKFIAAMGGLGLVLLYLGFIRD